MTMIQKMSAIAYQKAANRTVADERNKADREANNNQER